MNAIHVVAISGSLRRSSLNGALVAAAATLAPAGVEIAIYGGLAELPPFNPDITDDESPKAVRAFRAMLGRCDAVLISSPEYAHGVPGVLKNALDWIVGSGELADKPAAVLNASPRATHAWASLVETLTVMSAMVIPEASITVPLQGRAPDADGIAGDHHLARAVRGALGALAHAVRGYQLSRTAPASR